MEGIPLERLFSGECEMKRACLLILMPVLLAACANYDVRLDPVGPGGRLGREARFSISNDEEGELAWITLRAHGRRREKIGRIQTDVVWFNFVIDNESEDPVEMPIQEFKAFDDLGREYRLLDTSLPPDGASVLVVPQGPPLQAQLTFDTGGYDRLLSTGSVSLEWSYRYRGRKVKHRTRFLPIRYVRYYAPAYAWPEPWYGPYYWNFGFYYHED